MSSNESKSSKKRVVNQPTKLTMRRMTRRDPDAKFKMVAKFILFALFLLGLRAVAPESMQEYIEQKTASCPVAAAVKEQVQYAAVDANDVRFVPSVGEDSNYNVNYQEVRHQVGKVA